MILPATLSLTLLTLLPTLVSAHGFVASVTIDGQEFKGPAPGNGGRNSRSIIRQITTNAPVKGANNRDINCGPGAKPAALVADAKPGSVLEFDWRAGGDFSNWPHDTGPMLTYLASCGSESCDKFDAINAEWFKIDEVGRKPNKPQEWFQKDIQRGQKAAVALPSSLVAGNYLVRHEILGLHLSPQRGGAEFYPSCAQLRVTGSGTCTPSANELVKLPGAYKDGDPGIFVPEIFNPKQKYQFPGPKVAAFVSSPSSASNTPPASSNSNSSANSGAAANPKSKTCVHKKSNSTEPAAVVRPRHLSRIMRHVNLRTTIH